MKNNKHLTTLFCALGIILFSVGGSIGQQLEYPEAKRINEVDNYHGIKIRDPYKWMENTDSAEVRLWMKAQDKTLGKYIDNKRNVDLVSNAMEHFGNTGYGYSVPIRVGENYFYDVSSPSVRHRSLFVKNGSAGKPTLLLNMNSELINRETYNGFSVSPDGKFLTAQINPGSSTYGHLRIFDITNRRWLRERVTGTSSRIVGWTEQNGFYYISFGDSDSLNKKKTTPHSSIKYHQVGTPASEDKIVFDSPRGKDQLITLFSINISNDYRHLIVRSRQGQGDRNKLFLIETKGHKVHPLVENDDHMFNFIGSKGDTFYFYVNENAPNGKAVAINKTAGGNAKWQTIIPEQEEILAGGSTAGGNAMNLIGDYFTLLYRKGTETQLKIFEINGKLRHTIPLENGWIGSGLVGNPDGSEVFFSHNTFLSPSNVVRVDLDRGTSKAFFDRGLPIKRSDYVTKNTYYTSRDGTRIPIFISHKKGLELKGNNPVFMYAYGMGGWVATPWYQPQMLTFIEMGGVFIMPGIRGGGEFGEAWTKGGIKLNRQNAIDDYISAAQYMVDKKYTSAGKVVANGWSASGSLAAAATIQRPDLFGAAMIGIPSLDMIRYEKFTAFKGWTGGYGSSSIQEEFVNLYKWSPYHNIRSSTCYPPMIVTVGEKDRTTPPQHGYKFIALMQANQRECGQPALLKIVWGGGHGFGTTSEQSRETRSQELAFLIKVLNLDVDKLSAIKGFKSNTSVQ